MGARGVKSFCSIRPSEECHKYMLIVVYYFRVRLQTFKLSGGGGVGDQCHGDKFWITTDLTHGSGVRDGAAGVICGHRHDTDSEFYNTFYMDDVEGMGQDRVKYFK